MKLSMDMLKFLCLPGKGGDRKGKLKLYGQIPCSEEYFNLFAGTPTFSDYMATSMMLRESTLCQSMHLVEKSTKNFRSLPSLMSKELLLQVVLASYTLLNLHTWNICSIKLALQIKFCILLCEAEIPQMLVCLCTCNKE